MKLAEVQMGRIQDFRCTYDNENGFGSWASAEYAIRFPEAYSDCDMMVKLALAVKEHTGSNVCLLPFCHTLEAEALGGMIRLGNEISGPRTAGYRYRDLREVKELPALDLEADDSRRIRETLLACRRLKAMGEQVVFFVSGPMTILNGLIDTEPVFRSLLREPDRVLRVFEKLGQDCLTMMKAAEETGADMISYADPSAGVNLVGPKIAERIAVRFTARFLKAADRELNPETAVILCPKTSLALIGSGIGQWRDHTLPAPMEYIDAVLYAKKQVRFVGQDCLKHVGHRLEDCKLKELILIDADGGERQ